MIIEIDYNSDEPIYEQLKRQMIVAIARGDLKKGERLPSVRAMGENLGINLHTVRKTYNILKDEGYLVIDRRIGAMVSEDFKIDRNNILEEELVYLMSRAKIAGAKKEEIIEKIASVYDDLEVGK